MRACIELLAEVSFRIIAHLDHFATLFVVLLQQLVAGGVDNHILAGLGEVCACIYIYINSWLQLTQNTIPNIKKIPAPARLLCCWYLDSLEDSTV
jgi:hypothetical protein